MKHGITDVTVEIDGEEIEVTVEYTYYAGCAARMYLRNGDPGYPEEPAEVEICAIYATADKGKTDLAGKLDDAEADRIIETIFEREAEDARDGGYYD